VERIKAIRQSAPTLVINARTDVYLAQADNPSSPFERAVERANAYRAAGADCLFVPGVRDAATIAALVRAIDGPLNVLGVPGSPAVSKLEELGVKRVSVGSGPMRATLALVRRIALELRDSGTYSAFGDAIAHAEVNKMFTAGGD
jgi:2-methylisocitrate lyase-like PEP mutase family enzyme